MAELEYHNLDLLSVFILTVIFGSVGVVIFLLFFKKDVETTEQIDNQTEKESVSSSDNEKPEKTKKLSKQTSGPKKKVVKDCGASHPLLLASLKGHVATVTGIDLSSNGKFVASCSEDRTVRLWNVKDFASKEHKYTRCNVEFDYPTCISFSPDSRAFIVALGTEKVLRVYKIHKKKDDGTPQMSVSQEFDFPKEHKTDIINVAISPNGKFVISADKETQVIIWTTKGEILERIDTLLIYNSLAMISPDGNLVGACGFSPDVKLWHIGFNKNNEFTSVTKFGLKGHAAGILSFSFTNDSKRIATISKDGTWKIWDINVNYLKGQEAYLLHTGHYQSIEEGIPAHIALSHDYFTVAISLGHSIHLYNSSTVALEQSLNDVHQGDITALRWLADSRQLVSAGGSDRSVRVWCNPPGVKAHLQDLIDKLPKAKSDMVKERIETQIEEAKEYLSKFE